MHACQCSLLFCTSTEKDLSWTGYKNHVNFLLAVVVTLPDLWCCANKSKWKTITIVNDNSKFITLIMQTVEVVLHGGEKIVTCSQWHKLFCMHETTVVVLALALTLYTRKYLLCRIIKVMDLTSLPGSTCGSSQESPACTVVHIHTWKLPSETTVWVTEQLHWSKVVTLQDQLYEKTSLKNYDD